MYCHAGLIHYLSILVTLFILVRCTYYVFFPRRKRDFKFYVLFILGAVCHSASAEVRGQLAESVLSFCNVKHWHQTQVISLGDKRHLAGLEKGVYTCASSGLILLLRPL